MWTASPRSTSRAKGRSFDRPDRLGSPRVVIVNRSFARRYFPEGRALGRRVFVEGSSEVDRTQAVSGVRTMEQDVGEALVRPRMYALLVACFAMLAVVLAAVGIYGLIAYVVTQRTHEIGIRLALGASRGDVFRAMFREGAQLNFIGLILGVVAAGGLRGVVATPLFGVSPGDPASYLLAAAGFAAVALVVAALPARRASQVDPTMALRCE